MKVAICLLTCERFHYTKRAVESLVRFNDLGQFVLLHADDASEDHRNRSFAAMHGFERVDTPDIRQGCTATQRALFAAAAQRGCDWIVNVQNDWESERAIPLDLLHFVDARRDIHCLRLFGAFKMRPNVPVGDRHKGKSGKPADWRPLDGAPEPAEIGDIHWVYPPAATRTEVLTWLMAGVARERDLRVKSGELSTLTARVTENVMWHIGTDRTPEFRR